MTTETTPRRAATRERRRGGLAMTLVGVLCLVLGAAALLWTSYDLFWNPLVDPQVASQKVDTLREDWTQPAAAPVPPERMLPGDSVALLRIPRFGDAFEQPIVVGTDPGDLKKGIGWYEGTASPGAIGNFAIAGHRGTKGPLAPMDQMRVGDQVIVETREAVFTYELTNNPSELTVKDTDTWVIQPVPGHPETKPTEALITITTCQDLFRSPDRMIAFGKLVDTRNK